MENIKQILNQKPIFDSVITNFENQNDKINFCIAIEMLDHLFLISNHTLQIRILTRHAESLSHNFLEELDENKWKIISGNITPVSDCPLSDNFIRRYSDKIDWTILCTNNELSLSIFREFPNKIDWKAMSKIDLNPDFIEEFSEKLDWRRVSKYSILEEEFIRRFEFKVDWNRISEYQRLSKGFILEFSDKIDFYALLRSKHCPGKSCILELLKRKY